MLLMNHSTQNHLWQYQVAKKLPSVKMEVKATNKYKYCIYASLSRFGHLNRDDVGVKTCAINLACITYYIYAYHDFWKKLRCS